MRRLRHLPCQSDARAGRAEHPDRRRGQRQNRTVYPQKADFTFYGGIYRPVHLLVVPKAHFALDYHGAPGLRITLC